MTSPSQRGLTRATFLAVAIVAFALASDGRHRALAGAEEPIYVVDSPTAGILGHGEYQVQGRMGPESSILMGVRIGLKQVVHLGVSFGMQNVFGRGSIEVNDRLGVQLRGRLIQESTRPALAVGFNNQGTGIYDESRKRYERKSKGFYAVVSKNWKVILGHLSLHGGMNYSLERFDQDNITAFGAADWEPFQGFSVLFDADAARNDDHMDGVYGDGGVYIDMAARLQYGGNLSMMVVFRDLTGNTETDRGVGREFEIALMGFF